MNTIIRNVEEMAASERQYLESALGQPLKDDQRVVIRVVTPGPIPDQTTREEAVAGLTALSETAKRNRDAQGVTDEQADAAVEEAMQHVRRRQIK